MLFPALTDPSDKVALRFPDRVLTYRQLRDAATAVAEQVSGKERVAAWAVSEPEVAVGVIGALLAGVPVTPINPKAGTSELAHILDDSDPELVLCPPGTEVPEAAEQRGRVDVDLEAKGGELPGEPADDAPAIVVYTSGTTGPPKGAVLPRRAIASNLDALAEAWEWTGDDVVAHGLPLFHVHGLILGTLGPVRRGGGVHHLGRFSAGAAANALDDGATMLFAVPTMYHRVAAEAEEDREIVPRARRRPPARVRLRRASGDRAREDRAPHRPADRRALRHDRDADEHRRAGVGRATARVRRAAAEGRRAAARRRRWRHHRHGRRRDDRRDPRARPEPVPRVPQPAGRHRRGHDRRMVQDRRPRHPRARTATSASSAAAPPT